MDISAIHRSDQPQAVGTPGPSIDHSAQTRDVVQAVKALNATEMFGDDNELVFQMDRQARRMALQIVNKKTKEVLSQVPPEYVVRLNEDLKNSA